MTPIADEITRRLNPLVGLKLSIARRAADLRGFHFGQIHKGKGGTAGEYILHIQCAWRIEGPQGIVTGRSDLYEPVENDTVLDWDHWDYDKDKNLQDKLIGELLGSHRLQTRSFVNEGNDLVVEAVNAKEYGGVEIALSGGYRLVIFPAGSRGEDWRFFHSRTDEPHFVIAGGKIE
jgi:hypothetical protein